MIIFEKLLCIFDMMIVSFLSIISCHIIVSEALPYPSRSRSSFLLFYSKICLDSCGVKLENAKWILGRVNLHIYAINNQLHQLAGNIRNHMTVLEMLHLR